MNDTKNIGEKINFQRKKKAAWIYALSFITGLLTIILFELTENGTINSIIPLIIGLILMMIFVMYLNWAWYNNMDEFEKLLIGKACFWGLGSAVIVVPWMLLNLLGLVSEPDPYIIVLLAYSITFVLYYYEKFSSR